ncbi:hypothetical protein [Flexivirga sp. B27]
MKISRGLTATVGAAVLAAGMTTGMATAAAAPAGTAGYVTAGGTGWHWVNEGWEPAPQGDTTLPAARYCKTFDLALDTVSADVRGKVLSRWDNGNAKDTYYTGPLITRAVNLTTGKAKNYDMGGDMLETDYPDKTPHVLQMWGPVGVGMPIGASRGMPPSYYVFDGYHVVRFNAAGTERTATVKLGPETDLCAALR